MSSRHRSREAALKILYQADLLHDADIEKIIKEFWKEKTAPKADAKFTEKMVRGVIENLEEIDAKLDNAMENWELGRIGYMERAILRIGAYEILIDHKAPDKVAIDEGIELAKSYCDTKSEGFINGVLDRVMKEK